MRGSGEGEEQVEQVVGEGRRPEGAEEGVGR